MMDFLAGLPGKVATLVSRLTSTRAANLDNLDATVSTRAAAATALSTTQWTNLRAGYLDNLAGGAPISTVVNSIQTGFVSVGSPSSSSGEDTVYTDVTITAVTTAKAMVIVQPGITYSSGSASYPLTGRLTSSTNLRISGFNAAITSIRCRWYVIEFK